MTIETTRPATGSKPADLFDELLVVMVQAGDAPAAEQLARRWWPRLMRAAQRLVGREHAEDAAQEALVSILKGIGGLQEPDRFAPWAFAVLRRRCVDQIRKRSRNEAGAEPQAVDHAAGDAPLDRIAIARAMAALPPDQRFAAHLFFIEGLTVAEIAGAQGVPLGTAKSRLFHARRQLKAALSGEDQ